MSLSIISLIHYTNNNSLIHQKLDCSLDCESEINKITYFYDKRMFTFEHGEWYINDNHYGQNKIKLFTSFRFIIASSSILCIMI